MPPADPEYVQQNLLFKPVDPQDGNDSNMVEITEAEDFKAEEDTSERSYLSVTELTDYLKDLFETDPLIGGWVIVRGELSNVKRSSRGHVYFTLKDEGAAISGIIWAGMARSLAFDLEDGLDVYAAGQVEIYAPSGTYSLVVKKLEPVGIGSLQLAFQQIKERLEAEGLFLPEFKQPLPFFPRRIGLITSKTGAVIYDILRVIRRKNPLVDVLLAPVKVQGQGATEDIAAAIRELNHRDYDLDILIVARGGGSFEDLFCFSEEVVVRAIFESRIPIITGIGHEPDFSLADAAADYSASTPTAAAEMAVPDYEQLVYSVRLFQQGLVESLGQTLLHLEQGFDHTVTGLLESHKYHLERAAQKLSSLSQALLMEHQHQLTSQAQVLGHLAGELNAYSPLDTLARGYAIVTQADGHIIASVEQTSQGDPIFVRLCDGTLNCEVISDGKPSNPDA